MPTTYISPTRPGRSAYSGSAIDTQYSWWTDLRDFVVDTGIDIITGGGGSGPSPRPPGGPTLPPPGPGGGFTPSQPPGTRTFAPTQPATCPQGYTSTPIGCVDLSAGLPGGQPAVVPETPSTNGTGARMGMFGAPAVPPFVVGQLAGGRPIRRCPRGTVLGMDDLCYAKGSIPRKYRKWKPRRRPPVTAADARAIRMADSAKNRVKKLAGKVGFSCKKR